MFIASFRSYTVSGHERNLLASGTVATTALEEVGLEPPLNALVGIISELANSEIMPTAKVDVVAACGTVSPLCTPPSWPLSSQQARGMGLGQRVQTKVRTRVPRTVALVHLFLDCPNVGQY